MAKESLVVHIRKLLLKKYMKNHQIYIYIYIYFFFFFNKVEEKKITWEELVPLLGFKKNIGVCFAFIVFIINFANLDINYQCLSLSLSWIC